MYKIFTGAVNDGAKVGLVGKTSLTACSRGAGYFFRVLEGELML